MRLVLFYDDNCGFCSKCVIRVYQFDRHGFIEFAPLQGVLAGKLGLGKYAEKGGGTMVILRESDGVMFTKGDAWLILGETLGGIWAAFASVFSFFPKQVRNRVYDLVAKNRYRLAGKGNACAMPDEGLKKRTRE